MKINKFKIPLLFSGTCIFAYYSNNSSNKVQLHSSGYDNKETQPKRIVLPFNNTHSSNPTTLKPKTLFCEKTPQSFFENIFLQGMSKIATFHLIGSIGYLPIISDICQYFQLISLPFNISSDILLSYYFRYNIEAENIFQSRIDSKKLTTFADYCSWTFALVYAGGKGTSLPPFLGMIIAMYSYARFSGKDYQKSHMMISGTSGAFLAQILFAALFPFLNLPTRRMTYNFGIGFFYFGLSWLYTEMIQSYIENQDDKKGESLILSSYKWSYLYTSILNTILNSLQKVVWKQLFSKIIDKVISFIFGNTKIFSPNYRSKSFFKIVISSNTRKLPFS